MDLIGIFKECTSNDEFVKMSIEDRHEYIFEKYPDAAKAFPIVLTMIAREMSISPNGIKVYCETLNKGKTGSVREKINAYADASGKYCKCLYRDACKATRRRCNEQIAKQIYRSVYDQTYKEYRSLEDKTKKSERKFKEETKEQLEKGKANLLKMVVGPEVKSEDYEKAKQLIAQRRAMGFTFKINALCEEEREEYRKYLIGRIMDLQQMLDVKLHAKDQKHKMQKPEIPDDLSLHDLENWCTKINDEIYAMDE